MKVTTLRLPEELVDELDSEYAEYGHSNRSEYVRWLLERRKRIRENTENTQNTSAYSERNTDTDRLDELEARVARLEERDEEPVTPAEREPDTEAVPEPSEPTGSRSDDESAPVRGDAGEWRGLLDDPDAYSHENPDRRRAQMLAAGAAALEFLRDAEEPVTTAEFFELYERHPVDGQAPPGNAELPSKETYWRKTLKPALDAAADAELANQRSGSWDWVWTGDVDESGVGSGIYDPTAEF